MISFKNLAITLLLVALGSSSAAAVPFRLLHSFSGGPNDGAYPYGGVTLGGSTLYGTTHGEFGQTGKVFKLNTDGTGFQLLHSFAGGANDGTGPQTGVTLEGQTLYGTTYGGGSSDVGTVFRLNTDGTGFQVLHGFLGSEGNHPYGGITVSGQALYGTTANGGSSLGGTVFKLNTDGTGFQELHGFVSGDGETDGKYPDSRLTVSGSTIFGTTNNGGGGSGSGGGTVFRLNTDGSGYQILHRFFGGANDGFEAAAGVTLSGSTLYGTTYGGGSSNLGTVYKLNTDGSGFQVLHSFLGTNDGTHPFADLTLSGQTLYGTASSESGAGAGTVFKLNTNGSGFQVLHTFTGGENDGARPKAGVTLDGSTLYGTTAFGGNGGPGFNLAGTVFAITLPSAFALTRFDEPLLGATHFEPGVAAVELGFTTAQSATGGVNPLVGVATDGANRTLAHRSMHALTMFDAVDLSTGQTWT